MTDSIKQQISKVTAMSSSLDELEKKLEPLLLGSLSDTLSSLDTLQQAKLQVLLSYLINDLVFIYLKTRDIDPKTHPVVVELDRVKQYFGKIKDAEESNRKRTTELDKAAAGRFIKHAISEARRNIEAAESTTTSEPGPSDRSSSRSVPIRVTQKMKDREEYLRRLAEESEADESGLELIDDATDRTNGEVARENGKELAREKDVIVQDARDSVEVLLHTTKGRKRRRPMDPFGSTVDRETYTVSKSRVKEEKKNVGSTIGDEASVDSRTTSETDSSKKGLRSKKKKRKKTNVDSAGKGSAS